MITIERVKTELVEWCFVTKLSFNILCLAAVLFSNYWNTYPERSLLTVIPLLIGIGLCATYFATTIRGSSWAVTYNNANLVLDVVLASVILWSVPQEFTTHLYGIYVLLIVVSSVFFSERAFVLYVVGTSVTGYLVWMHRYKPWLTDQLLTGSLENTAIYTLDTAAMIFLGIMAVVVCRGILRTRESEAMLAEMGNSAVEAAHQLKTPLQVIQAIGRQHISDPDMRNMLLEEVDQITRFVKEFESLAKYEVPMARRFDLAAIVEHVLESLSIIYETKKNLELNKSIPKEPVLAHADPDHVQEIVTNLVRNALDAMDYRGRLTVSVGAHSFEWVELKVQDTGPGISRKQIKKIFQPYYSTKAGGGGLGLGLAIVKKYVDANSGIVYVESEEGKGTTFITLFPAADGVQHVPT